MLVGSEVGWGGVGMVAMRHDEGGVGCAADGVGWDADGLGWLDWIGWKA